MGSFEMKQEHAKQIADYCGNPELEIMLLDSRLAYFAMHEAEKALTDDQSVMFRYLLHKNSDGPKRTFNTVEAAMCHATAAQRAEAFLRALNLWEESA